jgi:hypothetical protein
MNEYTVLWPRDDIDPKKKNNNWLSQVGRAIFYRYENNKTYYSRHDLARLFEIKNYSEGRQSPQKYIDMWASRGDEKTKGANTGLNMANARGKRKGYANIDFTPFSMAPEIKRIIMSVLGTENQRVQVDSINPDARNQRALKKYQLYIKSKLDPILKKIGKPQIAENEFVPENITELELYETLGGFKLNFEIGIEKLAEFGLKNSDWTKIERQLKDDAMNFGFVVVKDYTDPDTGMAKVKYIDVTKFVCAWTDESQGDNSPFGGHFQKYSLPEVRKILLQNGYSEDETEGLVSKIAKWSYDTVYANDRYGWSWYSQRDTITDRMRYDDFFVDVLEFEYISKDSNFFKKRYRDGSVQFYKDMFGDVVNTDKKKTVDKRLSVLDKIKQSIFNKYTFKSKPQLAEESMKSKSSVNDIIEDGYNKIFNAIKAGVDINKAINIGIDKIKENIEKTTGQKWADEAEFRKDMTDAFKSEGLMEGKTSEKSQDQILQEQQRKLEAEINRQLSIVLKLKEKLARYESGDLDENDVKEQLKDVPEIEELKQKVKEAKADYNKKIAEEKRIQDNIEKLEAELERVKNRKEKTPKEKTGEVKQLSEEEEALVNKIKEENDKWDKEKENTSRKELEVLEKKLENDE